MNRCVCSESPSIVEDPKTRRLTILWPDVGQGAYGFFPCSTDVLIDLVRRINESVDA